MININELMNENYRKLFIYYLDKRTSINKKQLILCFYNTFLSPFYTLNNIHINSNLKHSLFESERLFFTSLWNVNSIEDCLDLYNYNLKNSQLANAIENCLDCIKNLKFINK